jgi:uncharacterized membrane protein
MIRRKGNNLVIVVVVGGAAVGWWVDSDLVLMVCLGCQDNEKRYKDGRWVVTIVIVGVVLEIVLLVVGNCLVAIVWLFMSEWQQYY